MKARQHMDTDFINLTTENLANEHLCCIIRSKKTIPVLKQSANGFPSGWMKATFLES